jgi:hypothetical protein
VPGIVRARVRQPPKSLPELLHPTPSMIRESSSLPNRRGASIFLGVPPFDSLSR